MSEQCLHYGEVRIPYRVKFVATNGKVSIQVLPTGAVRVDAPYHASLAQIKKAVSKRARWLNERLSDVRRRGVIVLPREYVSGESHFYLGRRYVLKIFQSPTGSSSVKLSHGQLRVHTPDRDLASVRALLWEWYLARASIVFERRLEMLWPTLGWVKKMPQWSLRPMKRQWGSCSPQGRLLLNPHLIKAPTSCIDYVLLHELCHLKHHNHSPHFYKLLNKNMPGWEKVKERLDEMAGVWLNT